jgi:predicted amidohydrolase YtcJ
MTREEAVYSYTLANAFASFSEKEKGSIEVGKWADLILLNNDLIHCGEDNIKSTAVSLVMVGGKVLVKK